MESVGWSCDGKFLATGCFEAQVYVWSVEKREIQARLSGHSQYVCTVSWSPTNPDVLVSGGGDTSLLVWNVNEPRKPLSVMQVKRVVSHYDVARTHSLTQSIYLSHAHTLRSRRCKQPIPIKPPLSIALRSRGMATLWRPHMHTSTSRFSIHSKGTVSRCCTMRKATSQRCMRCHGVQTGLTSHLGGLGDR